MRNSERSTSKPSTNKLEDKSIYPSKQLSHKIYNKHDYQETERGKNTVLTAHSTFHHGKKEPPEPLPFEVNAYRGMEGFSLNRPHKLPKILNLLPVKPDTYRLYVSKSQLW